MKATSIFVLPLGIPLSVLIVFLFSIVLLGCETKVEIPGSLVMSEAEYENWEIALVEMRIEKNEEFSDPAESPLKEASHPEFEGLNYFFPKKELVFRTPFVASAGTDTVSLTKRKGDVVPYLKRGNVSFVLEGQINTLAIFGPADTAHGDYLWLPFYDETSGKSTYGGGRYLDVEISPDGLVDLDFNYSYNPLCDYNAEKYNCTLPPEENRLPFKVEAGEKSFSANH
ncbi:MAG: DUF1684 domain-containing protein [Gemmatimonadales bacterium]|nr:DUF1684 domain-containing protein [Gemmatimonadales bacterium]